MFIPLATNMKSLECESASDLYYKCLTIVIYDRNDVDSTLKLQLQS